MRTHVRHLPALGFTVGSRLGLSLPLVLALVALVLAGCNGDGRTRVPRMPGVPLSEEGRFLPAPAGPGVVADPDSPIPDVPRPIGFVPVVGRSHSEVVGQVRHVHHVYQGRARAAEVANFYRRQLPRHGWQPVARDIDVDQAVVLTYTKGPEQLRVRVGERWGVTTVIVEMGDGSAPATMP